MDRASPLAAQRGRAGNVRRRDGREFDLLVVARLASAFVAGRKWRRPVLILSPLESGRPSERAVDLPDVVDENGTIRFAAHYAIGVGRRVHAKVMIIDGRVCSVGSANLDVTAGYWEGEMILIVEDPAIAAALESHIDTLLAQSPRVNRDNPELAKLARRRRWMHRWPGVMSV